MKCTLEQKSTIYSFRARDYSNRRRYHFYKINQCEQERTQTLTNLELALGNSCLAAYMLTGNRSMFQETDGSVAWLYHCPKVHSNLHTMNQCYDRIPILYKGQMQFVDPITRQTYPHAKTQNCSDRIMNQFQLDIDQKDSWYTLTPGIVHQDKPTIFGPQDISPVASHTFTGSQDAGMYTQNEPKRFWDSIFIMISPEYFKDQFLDTFGPAVMYLSIAEFNSRSFCPSSL